MPSCHRATLPHPTTTHTELPFTPTHGDVGHGRHTHAFARVLDGRFAGRGRTTTRRTAGHACKLTRGFSAFGTFRRPHSDDACFSAAPAPEHRAFGERGTIHASVHHSGWRLQHFHIPAGMTPTLRAAPPVAVSGRTPPTYRHSPPHHYRTRTHAPLPSRVGLCRGILPPTSLPPHFWNLANKRLLLKHLPTLHTNTTMQTRLTSARNCGAHTTCAPVAAHYMPSRCLPTTLRTHPTCVHFRLALTWTTGDDLMLRTYGFARTRIPGGGRNIPSYAPSAFCLRHNAALTPPHRNASARLSSPSGRTAGNHSWRRAPSLPGCALYGGTYACLTHLPLGDRLRLAFPPTALPPHSWEVHHLCHLPRLPAGKPGDIGRSGAAGGTHYWATTTIPLQNKRCVAHSCLGSTAHVLSGLRGCGRHGHFHRQAGQLRRANYPIQLHLAGYLLPPTGHSPPWSGAKTTTRQAGGEVQALGLLPIWASLTSCLPASIFLLQQATGFTLPPLL